MFRYKIALCALALQIGPTPAVADHHFDHGIVPIEAGQGAFAAMAEIVAFLEADPETDWARVDINALQRHLVDMNAVVLYSAVEERIIDGGLEMTVTGDGRVAEAIGRMVVAHAATLDGHDGLAAEARLRDDGVVLRVLGPDADAVTRIRALGFYGLLVTGAHHQAHHFAIASGRSPHGH